MDIIIDMFAQYSFASIIVFALSLAIGIKCVSELWEWFYLKFQNHFNVQSRKHREYAELLSQIKTIQTQIEDLKKDVEEVKKEQKLTQERLQENTRSYIIDKHHYFCYNIKAIDDINLQSLERRYLFYKVAKGNSYVDGLMEEIRALPRVTLGSIVSPHQQASY